MSTALEHSDDAVLERFGYKPELIRRLNYFGSFAISFSAISVTTGIFVTYGFALQNCGPIAIWTWPVVAVGQILIAFVFAELAGRIPVTGYAYQWVSRLTNSGFGWICGWTGFFFLSLAVAAVNYGLAPVVAEVLGIAVNPNHVTLITVILATLQAAINIQGVRLTSRLNNAAVYTEIIGMVGIAALVPIGGLLLKGPSVFHPRLLTAFAPGITTGALGALVLGALMGCWSLICFELSADLSEETIGAAGVVPTSIISSLIVVAVIGMIFLFSVTMVIPNLSAVVNSSNPIPDILTAVLGRQISLVFLIVVIVSMFACSTVCFTTASRLIYSMSRDDVFIFSKFFKKISAHKVPYRAILLVLIINFAAAIFSGSATDVLTATTILPALVYLMTLAAYAYRNKTLPSVKTFNLGKWSFPLTFIALLWTIIEVMMLTIPNEFHGGAKLVFYILLAGAGIYFLTVRPRVIAGKAGIKERY